MSVWTKPSGKFYTGVKIYVGISQDSEGKQLIGTILGGNNSYRDPKTGETYRGVLISFESGRIEWRRRNDIGMGPTFWVRRDDPAIAAGKWKVYE